MLPPNWCHCRRPDGSIAARPGSGWATSIRRDASASMRWDGCCRTPPTTTPPMPSVATAVVVPPTPSWRGWCAAPCSRSGSRRRSARTCRWPRGAAAWAAVGPSGGCPSPVIAVPASVPPRWGCIVTCPGPPRPACPTSSPSATAKPPPGVPCGPACSIPGPSPARRPVRGRCGPPTSTRSDTSTTPCTWPWWRASSPSGRTWGRRAGSRWSTARPSMIPERRTSWWSPTVTTASPSGSSWKAAFDHRPRSPGSDRPGHWQWSCSLFLWPAVVGPKKQRSVQPEMR
ncbi:hypothetical protein BH24ACT3_BH24ACT3_10580 [soil metagenome]